MGAKRKSSKSKQHSSSLDEQLREAFGVSNIFQLFSQKSDGSDFDAKRVEKSYKSLIRKWHPDRCHENPNLAEANTILLYKAHGIIMNERSRIYYLETRGEVLDKEIASAEFDFTKLLELTRVHLTDEKITKISERYRNSDQERKDIIELYQLYEGNMEKILFDVDFASIDDLDRITKIIQAAIDSNDIEHFKKFDKGVSKSFLRKYKREAAGLEKMKLEEELNNARLPSKLEEDLIKRQSKSQALFDAMIADAEKKFAPKKRVTKKSKKI